jgi:chromosome segregation ATPase
LQELKKVSSILVRCYTGPSILIPAEQKLADKEHELRTKERELHQKSQELQRKDSELARKSELLEKSKEPIKAFIEKELAQSFKAVTEAKTAHSQSPSKYTAGFVELAKGSHAENEEMFKRLAQAVGVKFEPLKEEFKQELGDEAVTKDVERPPISRRITPREVSANISLPG